MRGMVRNIRRDGGILRPILVLLLLFRLLIPSGYMIAPDHEGKPGLALCAAAARTAAQPAAQSGHDGHGSDPAPSKPGERPCPFAALAPPPLPPAPPALPPRALAGPAPLDLPAGVESARVTPTSPPPPATGPPLLV